MKWLRKMAKRQSAAEAGKSGDDRGKHRSEKVEPAKQDRSQREDLKRRKASHNDDPKGRDLERKEAMKRKSMESPRDGDRMKDRGGIDGDGSEVRQLRGALHSGDATMEKKRQAIEEQIGQGLDREEAARRIRALEKEWSSRRETIKSRLRELAGND